MKRESFEDFQRYLAFLGFTRCETTEAGFSELLGVGFTFEDCVHSSGILRATPPHKPLG